MDKSLSTRIGWTGYAKLMLLTKLHEWLGWLSRVFALALLLALFSLAFIIFSEPAGADYCCSRYFGTVDDGIWTVYAPNPAGGEPCVWVTVISDCPIEAYVIDCVDICPDEGCLVCVVPGGNGGWRSGRRRLLVGVIQALTPFSMPLFG